MRITKKKVADKLEEIFKNDRALSFEEESLRLIWVEVME